MMKIGLICALTLLAGAVRADGEPVPQRRPEPAIGPLIESLSLEDAKRLLAEAHYRAETVDSSGTPYLKSQSATGFFFLSLYDCAGAAKGEACRALELTTGAFTLRPAPSAEELARWNAASPFGFGVFDSSGSPYLRATLPLTGGVSEAHIKASLSLWTARMAAFAKFIESAAAPPSASAMPNAQSSEGSAAAALP